MERLLLGTFAPGYFFLGTFYSLEHCLLTANVLVELKLLRTLVPWNFRSAEVISVYFLRPLTKLICVYVHFVFYVDDVRNMNVRKS